jgi:hypothetical protein
VALGSIGGLFLLVALAAYTPFYRLWYEVMPFMKNVRAAGMAFYLPAFVACTFAALGLDRLFRRQVATRALLVPAAVLAGIALLGAVGVLQAVAESLAEPARVEAAMANAGALQGGSVRLLVVILAGGGILWAIATGRLSGAVAGLATAAVLAGDAWSVNREFLSHKPPAAVTYAEDDIIRRIREAPLPYRAWNPEGRYGGLAVYPGSWLMAYRIPTLLGYHGNELRTFDELLGGKNDWANQLNPGLWDLYAVRFILLREPNPLPGYSQVLGPVRTVRGGQGYLYEADTVPPYARVMSGALKVPEAQLAPTAADPRFPVTEVALYPDTASLTVTDLGQAIPAPPATVARLEAWEAGRMRIRLEGRDERVTYLVVAENWYPDWRATVDGAAVPVHRAQNALLSVQLPPGARAVEFEYVSSHHGRFKGISLAATAAACLLLVVPGWRERRRMTVA